MVSANPANFNRKIQRAKPTAFSRPGIELSDPAERRQWVDIPIEAVRLGDTIPDFGVVAAIGSTVGFVNTVNLISGAGKTLDLPPGTTVKAFHRVD